MERDLRIEQVQRWLEGFAEKYALQMASFTLASGDASFRRYFRVSSTQAGSYIVMDAPPPQENIVPYLSVGELMREAGLHVPVVYEKDETLGFILMSDLGRQTYLDVLNQDNAAQLMDAATDSLVKWQCATRPGVLPPYDEAVLRRELELFPEWYVKRHRHCELNARESALLEGVFARILANNLAQATVYVHRDFMPRNLMFDAGHEPGVIDFQDALLGPVSYDIASLMRDAFISWPEEFTLDVTIRYWQKARQAGIPVPEDFGVFWRDVEWMGLQRHLKVLGIFARIHYRDGKPKYLADTPRFIRYVRQTANRYDELKALNWILDRFEETKTEQAITF